MCKSKSSAMASTPKSRSNRTRSLPSTPTTPSTPSFLNNSANANANYPSYNTTSSSSSGTNFGTNSSSLSATLSSLHESFPSLVPFAEISSATNQFQSNRLSSSSWRCCLFNHDTVVFQRSYRLSGHSDPTNFLSSRLSVLGKSHHAVLAKLLGASIAGGGDHVYLVYEYVHGATLSECLRNPKNPSYTTLNTWISRIQIAADLSDGLEYIHNQSGIIHNRMKSSGVMITDPSLRAKICHFGSADLSGELEESKLVSGGKRIDGTRGYIAPELIYGGKISYQSDVFAFGVVLLELISGDEPIKFRFRKDRKEFERLSLIDSANKAVETGAEGVRKWVDSRLRDSFPIDSAERLILVALKCVESDPASRPDMAWVTGRISKIYLESKVWAERVNPPTDFSVSMTPR